MPSEPFDFDLHGALRGPFSSRRRALYHITPQSMGPNPTPHAWPQVAPAQGPFVSPVGFGGYRIGFDAPLAYPECAHALDDALEKGLNLFDTSSNYGDGQSEVLLGQRLHACFLRGTAKRSDICVVTKGGYVQGANRELAESRMRQGKGFSGLITLNEHLWHCISGDFLADQIERSLLRLNLDFLDVYLIHNPEYMLSHLAATGVPLNRARAEFYQAIEDAFVCLEKQVSEGKIRCYGVSSNTLGHPTDESHMVDVDELWHAAQRAALRCQKPFHSFRVVQVPLNWVEVGAAFYAQGTQEKSLLKRAQDKGLGVLINRPWNAIYQGNLIRLTRPTLNSAESQQLPESERKGYLNWCQLAADLEAMAKEVVGDRPGFESVTLSQWVLATLVWLPGVSAVLSGIRRRDYVNDAQEALRLPVLLDAQPILAQLFERLEFHR